jgi:hypothetical protein
MLWKNIITDLDEITKKIKIKAYRSATRYRCPNFSSSAMTQSVTQGIPWTWRRGKKIVSGHSILWICLRKLTFCIQAIHHTAHQLQFVLKTKVDKICIDKNAVWRNKCGVVCEKQGRCHLRAKKTDEKVLKNKKRYLDTYTLRTAFAFSASSFFFCFKWFSFLPNFE